MAIKREMIGIPFPPITFEVERGKIREFATAIGDTNPIYQEVEAAQAEGYADLPIPPTFPTAFRFWGKADKNAPPVDLGFPAFQTLHGEEEYTYLAPIYPGDTVTGVQRLVEVKEKSGKLGTMEIATLEMVWTNQHGREVLRVRTVAIVPGGTPS